MSTSAEHIDDQPLVVRKDCDGIATLSLNRPRQFNALSEDLLDALQSAFDHLRDDDGIRVVVLAGRGKVFCTGHDLKQMRARPNQDYYRELFRKCADLMMSMTHLPQPIIASVHGVATAAGCQLVATADLAVAADDATFAVSGINVGLFCAAPAVPLSRNMHRKAALEMLLTGDFIDAENAARLGLVNRVVPAERLQEETLSLARHIAQRSPLAVRAGKQMFYRQIEQDLPSAYDYAADVMARNMMSEDAAEGIDAFIEKRSPAWRGR